MKTKNIIYGLMMGGALLGSSCSDFTEIDQKGKNLLQTTDELEMLLNAEFSYYASDEKTMCGDMIYAFSPVATDLSQPTKTRNVIMWTWDETNQDKMAELTNSDNMYDKFYGYIGTICNPILNQIDAADGTEAKKNQLKCEALVLRAYCHYLLVNKFAKAYNPSSAATDRGIIIMTEDKDISVAQEQSTVQEVYDQILADVNEAIEIGGLPAIANNRMRMCQPCAYAVKALAQISMQQFDEAEATAKQALAINGTVSDYTQILNQMVTGYLAGGSYPCLLREKLQCEQDYFFVPFYEFYNSYLPESLAHIEDGNYVVEKIASGNMAYDYLMDAGEMITGLTGTLVTNDLSSYWNGAGLESPQMYLVVAEAELHNGNINAAMEAIDAIRVCRIDPEKYAPLVGNVSTEAEAMRHIKETASGEGIYSVWNFINRKRWNQVSGWEETYTRNLLGTSYTLSPESPMWIFPMPMNAINNNSKLQQNYKQ